MFSRRLALGHTTKRCWVRVLLFTFAVCWLSQHESMCSVWVGVLRALCCVGVVSVDVLTNHTTLYTVSIWLTIRQQILYVWWHRIVMREENVCFVIFGRRLDCVRPLKHTRAQTHTYISFVRCVVIRCSLGSKNIFWFFAWHVLMWLKQSILNSDRHTSSVCEIACIAISFSVYVEHFTSALHVASAWNRTVILSLQNDFGHKWTMGNCEIRWTISEVRSTTIRRRKNATKL